MLEAKKRRVQWTRAALAGLAEIATYLADKNPDAAEKLIERLRQRAATLANIPEQGRPGRVPATRELSVTGTSYLLIYRSRPDVIEIIRVHHTRQIWPPISR